MAQRLKEGVRRRIVEAALREFARHGYRETTMAAIAQAAEVATSNVYKYYPNKEDLFYEVVRPEHAAQLLRLLRRRLRELRQFDDWTLALADRSVAAAQLLDFWICERNRTLILIDGSAGTRYEPIRTVFIAQMQSSLRKHLRRLTFDPHATVERQIFENTIHTLCAILRNHDDKASISAAVIAFWHYQLAGLKAFASHTLATHPKTGESGVLHE